MKPQEIRITTDVDGTWSQGFYVRLLPPERQWFADMRPDVVIRIAEFAEDTGNSHESTLRPMSPETARKVGEALIGLANAAEGKVST